MYKLWCEWGIISWWSCSEWPKLVGNTAVFSVVTQRSFPQEDRALRDDTKNGCLADFIGPSRSAKIFSSTLNPIGETYNLKMSGPAMSTRLGYFWKRVGWHEQKPSPSLATINIFFRANSTNKNVLFCQPTWSPGHVIANYQERLF